MTQVAERCSDSGIVRAARLDRTFHPPAVMPEQILALALAAADVASAPSTVSPCSTREPI